MKEHQTEAMQQVGAECDCIVSDIKQKQQLREWVLVHVMPSCVAGAAALTSRLRLLSCIP
jgi:hypothetical protein